MRKRRETDFNMRLGIAKYLKDGYKISEIARILDRDYTVVYNEIRNRSVNGKYNPIEAQEDADDMQAFTEEEKAERRRINDTTKKYIEDKLAKKWSPIQIASQIEKDTGTYISYPTIYRYIRKGLVKVNHERDLRQGGKKYNKSSEKRGKLDVGNRVIRYRPSKSK
ncbi:transposase [Staphylococcus caprae]|uniref:transposase n=1 Tax=Staphylococcus caprae TaxID=29380 RepID=UPI003B212BB2